jgi:hypothetical protein
MIKELKYNWVCGRHSGFKLCDILFYIFVWNPLWKYDKWIFPKYYRKWLTIHPEVRYIQCPVCTLFSIKIDKVNKCNCSHRTLTNCVS